MADVGRLYSSKGILMVVPMFLMHPLGFQHAVQNNFLCKRDSHVFYSTTKKRVSESNPGKLDQAAASSFRIIRKNSWKMRNGLSVTFHLTLPAATLGCGDSTAFSSPSSLAVRDTSGRLLCPLGAPHSSIPRREGRH